MSQGNVNFELRKGTPFPAATTAPTFVVQIANASATSNFGKAVIFGYVGGAQATYCAVSGVYNIGCIMIDTSTGEPRSNTAAITTAATWQVLTN